MLVDEFGFHPLAARRAGTRPRPAPKVDEFKGYVAARDLRGGPRRGRRGACGPPRWTCSSAGTSWCPSTAGRVPALDEALARWTRGGPMLARGGRLPRLRGARRDHRLLSPPRSRRIEDEIDETEARGAHPLGRCGRARACSGSSGPRHPAARAAPAAGGLPGPAPARPPVLPGQHGGPTSATCTTTSCGSWTCWTPSARWRPARWTPRWRSARTGSTRR